MQTPDSSILHFSTLCELNQNNFSLSNLVDEGIVSNILLPVHLSVPLIMISPWIVLCKYSLNQLWFTPLYTNCLFRRSAIEIAGSLLKERQLGRENCFEGICSTRMTSCSATKPRFQSFVKLKLFYWSQLRRFGNFRRTLREHKLTSCAIWNGDSTTDVGFG